MNRISFLVAGSLTWLSLIATAAAAEPAASPENLVNPGDPAVTGTFIEPYRNAWEYSKHSPSGEVQVLGRWIDQVIIEGEPGQEQVTRWQRFPSPAGPRILVNRFRRADLSPLSFEVRADEGQVLQRVDFEPGQLRIRQFGQEQPIERPLIEPVFDWYLYGLLIASFPLEQGYSATFPVLSPTLEPMMRQLEVTGRETMPGPDGSPWPAWRVETDEGLTFWISDNAPYILHLTKKLEDGSRTVWRLDTDSDHSNFLELRVYKTKENQRDPFLDYFEEHYLESQEGTGLFIWGQFRDLDVAQNAVWLRGYRSMEERQVGLLKFYTGAHWTETSQPVREMLAERATHVYFLEPVWSGDGFDEAERVASDEPGGIVVAQVFLAAGELSRLAWSLEQDVIPSFVEHGATSLGLFQSSEEVNNFPALPFIEDKKVVAWFASFASRDEFEAARRKVVEMAPPFETFVLEPGKRSRLRHRGE